MDAGMIWEWIIKSIFLILFMTGGFAYVTLLERRVLADGFHELVGDVDAVVQVERLAVEVTRRFPDLKEFLDLRVEDIEIAGGRAAAQRALRNR